MTNVINYLISRTELGFIDSMPWKAFQNLTGVKEEHRGRGLGKWLKANMILMMRDKYPDIKYISTGNATENAPMLSTNNRMGFKIHKKRITYKYQLDDFRKRFDM